MTRAFALLALLPLPAEAACRQALALGLDVSGSVDPQEYRLQLDGLATALNSERVQDVLFAQSAAPIKITVYEWSGPSDQTTVLPWKTLGTPDDLVAASQILRSHQRGVAAPTTAIGSALLKGFSLLEQQPNCWKRTLDLSGDGPANTGPRPQDISHARTPTGVVVNGLVIGAGNAGGDDHRARDIKELSSYYSTYVIRGAGSFVEVALGFDAYAEAMERKLLRELASIAIGEAKQTP